MSRQAAGLLGALGWTVPLLVGGAYLHQAEQIPVMFFGDPLGPRAFPRLITGLLALSALLWMAETIAARRAAMREDSAPGPVLLPIAVMAWFSLYVLTLETLGFVIGSVLFLLGMLVVFHPGRWVTNLSVALVLPVAAQILFSRILSVPLPAGPIAGL